MKFKSHPRVVKEGVTVAPRRSEQGWKQKLAGFGKAVRISRKGRRDTGLWAWALEDLLGVH